MSVNEISSVAPGRRQTPDRQVPGSGAGAWRRRRIQQVGRAYTRFVRLLKVVLPTLAVGLLALIAAWPHLRESAQTPPVRDKGELEMLNARYVGSDQENRPFLVVADRAVRSTADPQLMDLTLPEAEMTLADGTWVAIRADHGRYDERTGMLFLEGGVNLFHDKGYEFRTEEAHVDVGAGNAWGDRPITGQGPFGELFAQGFRLLDKGHTIVFSGRAHLTLAGSPGTAAKE